MTTAIRIQDLTFSYQDAPVLINVNLEIPTGSFYGVIGPNGGGKTTLLKLMLGFLKPSQGTVKIFNTLPQKAHCLMAYVPQALQFDKQFPISVMELVLEGRLAHLPWYGIFSKEDKEIALEALEKVGLQDLSNRPLSSLSGGQTQRVLIARALASRPKVLLLDEPTASVDSQSETAIYDILANLRGKMTIIMVTHDLPTTIQLVERVVCVQRTVTTLAPEEVCEHFALGLYHPPLIKLPTTPGRNP